MRVDCLATCNTGGRWLARCLVGTAIVMFKGLRLGPLAPGWWDSFQSCPMHLKRSGARVWKAYQPTAREKPCSTVSVEPVFAHHPADGVMPVLRCALGARRVAAAPKPSVRAQRRGVRLVPGRCASYFERRGGACAGLLARCGRTCVHAVACDVFSERRFAGLPSTLQRKSTGLEQSHMLCVWNWRNLC